MVRFRHSEGLVPEESCALSKGFTLPEVCVALAVFLAGMAGILGCWNFFNREVADERYRLERYYDVLSAMESLIAEKTSCADTLVVADAVTVRLKRVSWSGGLAWAVAGQDGFTLTRLVRCR